MFKRKSTKISNIKAASSAVIYQLCISNHKAMKSSSIEARFGRKQNTPCRSKCISPKSSNFSLENKRNLNLSDETVLTDDQRILTVEKLHWSKRGKWYYSRKPGCTQTRGSSTRWVIRLHAFNECLSTIFTIRRRSRADISKQNTGQQAF